MSHSTRAFLGLVPDDDGIDFLSNRVQLFRARGWERFGRFLPADHLHVTLRFLGDVEPEPLEAFIRDCAALCASSTPATYELGPCQLFPRVSRARIVASVVRPSPELKALAAALESLAVSRGFPAEDRLFKPHVTLARLRNGMKRPNVPSRPGTLPQTASELVLFRSLPTGDGSVYEPLERFALGRPAGFDSQDDPAENPEGSG